MVDKLKKQCQVKECDGKYYAIGYCFKHYRQIRKYGKIRIRMKNDPNRFLINENCCLIELYKNNGTIAGHAIIDLVDVNKCKAHKWCMNSNNYVITRLPGGKIQYLHNYILNRDAA